MAAQLLDNEKVRIIDMRQDVQHEEVKKEEIQQENTPQDFATIMKEQIRNQIELEMETDRETIQYAQLERENAQARLKKLEAKKQEILAQMNETANQIYKMNQLLVKFDRMDEEIEKRYAKVLAAMAGQVISSKARTNGPKASRSHIEGYHATYVINGQPALFTDLTKLTYRLWRNFELHISVAEIREAWENQTGYALFSESHKNHTDLITLNTPKGSVDLTIGLVAN